MAQYIERIEILLLLAAVVVMLARRFRLPYTVGLVCAGAVLAVCRVSNGVELTKELIFTSFLPPLIFEAAINTSWSELRRDLPAATARQTKTVKQNKQYINVRKTGAECLPSP